MKLDGPWRSEELASKLYITCPTCDRGFNLVSGFLQHIESPSCEEGLWSGRRSAIGLLHQLRHNMKLPMQIMFDIEV